MRARPRDYQILGRHGTVVVRALSAYAAEIIARDQFGMETLAVMEIPRPPALARTAVRATAVVLLVVGAAGAFALAQPPTTGWHLDPEPSIQAIYRNAAALRRKARALRRDNDFRTWSLHYSVTLADPSALDGLRLRLWPLEDRIRRAHQELQRAGEALAEARKAAR